MNFCINKILMELCESLFVDFVFLCDFGFFFFFFFFGKQHTSPRKKQGS